MFLFISGFLLKFLKNCRGLHKKNFLSFIFIVILTNDQILCLRVTKAKKSKLLFPKVNIISRGPLKIHTTKTERAFKFLSEQ